MTFFGVDGGRKKFVEKNFESESHDEETAEHGVRHVEEEVAMVEVADAAVDPWTVMIHLQYAPSRKNV